MLLVIIIIYYYCLWSLFVCLFVAFCLCARRVTPSMPGVSLFVTLQRCASAVLPPNFKLEKGIEFLNFLQAFFKLHTTYNDFNTFRVFQNVQFKPWFNPGLFHVSCIVWEWVALLAKLPSCPYHKSRLALPPQSSLCSVSSWLVSFYSVISYSYLDLDPQHCLLLHCLLHAYCFIFVRNMAQENYTTYWIHRRNHF